MKLFGRAPKEPPIAGALGHWGLSDWWFASFTKEERDYIEARFKPMGMPDDWKPLTQGAGSGLARSACGMLSTLGGWFKKPTERSIAERIFAQASREAKSCRDMLDLHFHFQLVAQVIYGTWRTHPELERGLEDVCLRQIAISEKAAKQWKATMSFAKDRNPLPNHHCYRELVDLYPRQGRNEEAIMLAERAKKEHWDGDWDRAIAEIRNPPPRRVAMIERRCKRCAAQSRNGDQFCRKCGASLR